MKIYLDIDGVLLTKHGEPAIGVLEFLKRVTKQDCHWLTTHCKDDSTDHVVQHLKKKLPEKTWKYIEKIKGNGWDYLKTEDIDFSSGFLWFDDNLMYAEKEVLRQHNTLDSFRMVDLKECSDQLQKEFI
jgi:hypothetical protein